MNDAAHDPRLYNEDLAPVPQPARTWTMWNIAALWVGMAVCIPTYMLASGLVSQGMTMGQALVTIALANVIVLIPISMPTPARATAFPFPCCCVRPLASTAPTSPR